MFFIASDIQSGSDFPDCFINVFLQLQIWATGMVSGLAFKFSCEKPGAENPGPQTKFYR